METNKNGEQSAAFDSFVALSRPSASEERGRSEKKKAELNIADRGCDIFWRITQHRPVGLEMSAFIVVILWWA